MSKEACTKCTNRPGGGGWGLEEDAEDVKSSAAGNVYIARGSVHAWTASAEAGQ